MDENNKDDSDTFQDYIWIKKIMTHWGRLLLINEKSEETNVHVTTHSHIRTHCRAPRPHMAHLAHYFHSPDNFIELSRQIPSFVIFVICSNATPNLYLVHNIYIVNELKILMCGRNQVICRILLFNDNCWKSLITCRRSTAWIMDDLII